MFTHSLTHSLTFTFSHFHTFTLSFIHSITHTFKYSHFHTHSHIHIFYEAYLEPQPPQWLHVAWVIPLEDGHDSKPPNVHIHLLHLMAVTVPSVEGPCQENRKFTNSVLLTTSIFYWSCKIICANLAKWSNLWNSVRLIPEYQLNEIIRSFSQHAQCVLTNPTLIKQPPSKLFTDAIKDGDIMKPCAVLVRWLIGVNPQASGSRCRHCKHGRRGDYGVSGCCRGNLCLGLILLAEEYILGHFTLKSLKYSDIWFSKFRSYDINPKLYFLIKLCCPPSNKLWCFLSCSYLVSR